MGTEECVHCTHRGRQTFTAVKSNVTTGHMSMMHAGSARERVPEADLHRNKQVVYSMWLKILKDRCFIVVFKLGSSMLKVTLMEYSDI